MCGGAPGSSIQTFAGTAGQKVALSIGAGPAGEVSILKPNTAPVTDGSIFTSGAAAFLETVPLPVTGTYTVLMDPSGANIGPISLSLHDAPDLTTSITPGGPSVVATTEQPGQRVLATFTVTEGQRVSLRVTDLSFPGFSCQAAGSIVAADGTVLRSNPCLGFNNFVDATDPLPAGSYAVVFDPGGALVGSGTLTLYDVPADVTGPLTVDGPAVPVMIQQPGQNATFTFGGTSAEVVTVRIDPNNLTPFKCVTVTLLRETGGVPLASATPCTATYEFQHTLPATDTYIVRIDPNGTNIGSLSVRVFHP